MGARHALTVYAEWRQLADRPFRVLMFMALRALDSDAVPRYWGGRSSLLVALPDTGAADGGVAALKYALKELKAAGAISQTGAARRGRQAEYTLHVRGALSGPEGVTECTPSDGLGVHSVPPEQALGVHSVTDRGAVSAPRGVPGEVKSRRRTPPPPTPAPSTPLEPLTRAPRVDRPAGPLPSGPPPTPPASKPRSTPRRSPTNSAARTPVTALTASLAATSTGPPPERPAARAAESRPGGPHDPPPLRPVPPGHPTRPHRRHPLRNVRTLRTPDHPPQPARAAHPSRPVRRTLPTQGTRPPMTTTDPLAPIVVTDAEGVPTGIINLPSSVAEGHRLADLVVANIHDTEVTSAILGQAVDATTPAVLPIVLAATAHRIGEYLAQALNAANAAGLPVGPAIMATATLGRTWEAGEQR